MFYKKQGLPEIGEIVICTVKKVLPDSVFVLLDEYEKEAMIHISEVAPGRIRNIRDFVKEDKKVICKVLDIKKEKGHVDLSLRRVNQAQKSQKNNEYKQEQKAENILSEFGRKLKIDLKGVYEKVGYKIIEKYSSLTNCFKEIINDKTDLKELKIDQKIGEDLVNLVKERIKPPEVEITGTIKFESESSNGIEIIKKALNQNNKNILISYISAPNYRLRITAGDYKTAESILKKLQDNISVIAKQTKSKFELSR